MSKSKKNRIEYDQDHKLAKTIMFIYQVVVTVLITYVLIVENPIYILPLFIAKELGYFFGVNTVGYIIETIKHHKHKHNKV